MKIKLVILFLLIISLCTHAAEKVYQIDVSAIEERSLYGGLGSANGPIGSVTEFFEAELFSSPLLSIPGLRADYFKNKKLYIFKETNSYFLCVDNTYNKKCFECSECGLPEKQQNLVKFDVANIGHIRKKKIKTLQYSAVSGPAFIAAKENNLPTVEFQFLEKNHSPLSLIAKHNDPYFLKNPKYQTEKNTLHIFKSEADPVFYLCQRAQFTESCFSCINCAEKLDKINSNDH